LTRLVYIVSAVHSGSTVFNTILGTAANFVGLGEVMDTFNRIASGTLKRGCTCGASARDCPVWGPVVARGTGLGELSMVERYALLIDALDIVYGPEVTLVDASKRWDTLEALWPVYGKSMDVLFLTKDIRGFVGGRMSREERKSVSKRRFGFVLERLPVWIPHLLMWLHVNRRIMRTLKKNNIEFLHIGYEELCFATDRVLERVAEFLGVEKIEPDLSFQPGNHHIVQGNKFFIDGGVTEISYDARWLRAPGMSLVGIAALPFMRLNRELVYSNISREWRG
jgi:hypothetical protein